MFLFDNILRFAAEGRTAAIGREGSMTYAQMYDRSEALAIFLLNKYPGKSAILLWGDKENDMLCCMLAALKTGRPYVVIPYYYPESRIR
ncbi:MAG: D-alanine--poly(phosphoribitol) ligase, partial [Eubacteriales bacterium]|nr:D-alanine--poly(phosphoribitol) ligase [Eubacteriales bacterium]